MSKLNFKFEPLFFLTNAWFSNISSETFKQFEWLVFFQHSLATENDAKNCCFFLYHYIFRGEKMFNPDTTLIPILKAKYVQREASLLS